MHSEPLVISRNLHFDRVTKSASDYYLMPFDVDEGTAEVRIRYDYDHGSETDPNVVDLGLIGPGPAGLLHTKSFKGWSGSNKMEIFVSKEAASPSYYPGEIAAGRWNVLFGLYKISEAGCSCEVEITLSKNSTQPTRKNMMSSSIPASERAPTCPVWLRGDLHVHSHHSDGELSVESVVKEALRRGLDYVAITDHNTTSHWGEISQLARPGLTVMVGEELTSYYGHANVWNSSEWLDFRMRSQEDARAVIDEAHRRGLLFSVNHPTSLWPWDFKDVRDFDCMEVWSGLWFAMNAGSLQWWDTLAGEGKRVTGVGGSDFHKLEDPSAADIFSIGTPTTWVFSRDRSPQAIVDGIRSGRVSISRGPAGPCLTLEGENGRGVVPMGDEMTCMRGEEIKLRVEAHGAHGLGLRICSSEGYCEVLPVDTGELLHEFRTTAGGSRFFRAELVEKDGDWRSAPPSEIEMVSLTNHLHVKET